MNRPSASRPAMLAAALALALGLGGCNRASDRSTDPAANDSPAQSDTAQHNAEAEASPAANDTDSTPHTVSFDASDRVADAAITASIDADFARDQQLSALAIDVDTVDGHVTLRGTAPNDDARDHATKLASTVRGVTSVDNELTVQR